MQDIRIPKEAFDQPFDPISVSGVLHHIVELEQAFNDMLNGQQPFDRMLYSDPTELGITGNTLATPTLGIHTVAAETGTTDDLESIPARNNTYLFLKAKVGHFIGVRHNIGNIQSSGGIDVTLSGHKAILLFCSNGLWGTVGTNRPVVFAFATVDPRSSDDAQNGYSVGSFWINTTLKRAWVCVDSVSGSAKWRIMTALANGFSSRASGSADGDDLGTSHLFNSPGVSLGRTTDADGSWLIVTNAAAPATAYYRQNMAFTALRPAYSPVIDFVIKTPADITSLRFWIMITTALAPSGSGTLTAGTKALGFRYSPADGDTSWVPFMNDGTTQTLGTAIGSIAASTMYRLSLAVYGAIPAAYLRVNDGPEQALGSLNFPAIATDMECVAEVTGSVKELWIGQVKADW